MIVVLDFILVARRKAAVRCIVCSASRANAHISYIVISRLEIRLVVVSAVPDASLATALPRSSK